MIVLVATPKEKDSDPFISLRYLFELMQNIDAFLGLGYESCCLGLRIYVSDKRLIDTNTLFEVSQLNENEIYAWKEMISLENKSRITFEFELKGLSSKKNKLTRFFQKSILNL